MWGGASLLLLLCLSVAVQATWLQRMEPSDRLVRREKNKKVVSKRTAIHTIMADDLQITLTHDHQAQEKIWAGLQTIVRPSLTDQFDVEEFIGSGSVGLVFRARDRLSKQQVAVKCVPMSDRDSIIRTWYLNRRFREHNMSGVVLSREQLYSLNPHQAPKVIQDQFDIDKRQVHVCFVEELLPLGTLDGGAHDSGCLEERTTKSKHSPETVLKVLTDVASTVAAMHKINVQHRDIRVANILVEKQNDSVSGKLADFDYATTGNHQHAFDDDVQQFGMTLGLILINLGLGVEKCKQLPVWNELAVGDFTRLTDELGKQRALRSYLPILWNTLKGGLHMSTIAQMMANARLQHS